MSAWARENCWCEADAENRDRLGSPPVITVEKEVLVERPADEVFDFLADVRNEERWNPNVLRIESEADGPLTVGGTFEGIYRRGGRMRFELVEAVRPSGWSSGAGDAR